jgi:CDP-glycerol glycerophosphotransferase (TagB/SpsB family)
VFKAFHPLYIDPGTGSALFSIVIGAVAVVYFFSRAFLIKLKSFFFGQKGAQGLSNKYRYVIYAEDKRYWSLFKPVLDEFENRELELLYLTSSEDDPVFNAGYRYILPEFIGKGNKAYARLNMLSASFVLATTPGLDVYQWKKSKTVNHYSHVLHAVVDATLYRMFALDYFDSVLMTGAYQADDIRKIERLHKLPEKQLVTVGCSYLDEYEKLMRQIHQEEPHEFTVLVSPSWGPSSLLIRYGEKLLDPLADTGWRILIRPHPQSKISESKNLAALTERYRHNKNFVWDYERDNIRSLSKADVMISDFSGIIFDYVFLRDKPVIYVNYEYDLRPYDAHFLPDVELWQVKTLRKIGVELREADFGNIKNIIMEASSSAVLNEARQEAKETAWQYRGMAGKLTADFMVSTVNRFQNQADFETGSGGIDQKKPEGIKPE